MYEYGNARVRAMKGRLLTGSTFAALVERYDVDYVVSTLGHTAYAPDIAVALAKGGGVDCVDEAVRLNLTRTTRALHHFYEGEARGLIGLLVGRYDLFNLLTIVRGQAARVAPDEVVQALLPGGDLPESALSELARQPELRQAVDLMATWRISYARPLTAALREYGQTSDPAVLELALAKHFYRGALGQLQSSGPNVEIVRRTFAEELDVLNVTTVLRISQHGRPIPAAEAGRQLLEGGARLDVAHLLSLCALGDFDTVLAGLAGTPYGPVLQGVAAAVGPPGPVARAQRALERYLASRALRLFHGDPLGIGTVVAYLAAKTAEVTNLRLIARGISLGLGRQEILDEVWVPAT